jgi:uncharacterized protein YllA (UPF0747 family)
LKAVVTGQQLGLLGGPLYTTYKVLGAARYARELSGRCIYWLESNDADFEEIKCLTFLNADNELARLEWHRGPTEGLSCGLLPVDRHLRTLIESFFGSVRQTEFTPSLREMVMDCYSPGTTLVAASTALARELFGRFDVELFNPSAGEFRDFTRPLLLKEADMTGEGDRGNFFVLSEGRRLAVFKRNGKWVTRNNTSVDIEHLPLVPNVRTRNLCQDAYFRTHTYIAGPAEEKYIADLDNVYAAHGVDRARVKKRMSTTLVEPAVSRKLARLSVTPADVVGVSADVFLSRTVDAASPIDRAAFEDNLARATGEYLDKVDKLEPGPSAAFRSEVEKLARNHAGRVRAAARKGTDSVAQQAKHVSNALFPCNSRQERVFTIIQYMNLYGGHNFVDWLYEKYDDNADLLYIEPTERGTPRSD